MEKNTNFRENRQLAWIVFAVVIILAVILSGGGGLRSAREKALRVYRAGVDGSGIGVCTDLGKRVECANNLASLAGSYKVGEEVISEINKAASVLDAGESSMSGFSRANTDLTRAVESLYTILENASLSEKDAKYALSEYKEFTSRALTMSRDSYNNEADTFNAILGRFPASIVAKLTRVNALPLFR